MAPMVAVLEVEPWCLGAGRSEVARVQPLQNLKSRLKKGNKIKERDFVQKQIITK